MCVVSMVLDYYQPLFPEPIKPLDALPYISPTIDLVKLQQLIDEFRECIEAAKKIDILTKKPDCEDPEKIKLLARITELEQFVSKSKKKKKSKKSTKKSSK